MLTKIYIDNFRCLSNFKIEPKEFQLWMGDNGSGKTSVFDALRKIQRLLKGDHVEDIFNATSLTSWDQRQQQRIEVSVALGNDKYDYRLTIVTSRQLRKVRIECEELKWNESIFFLFNGKDAHLYRINRDTQCVEEGVSFPADWSRSIIPTLAEREDNWPLLRFREVVNSWLLILPVPSMVNREALSENRFLSEHGENFAEWYRCILQEKPGICYKAKEHLEDALSGFEHISLKEVGQSRRLMATFRIGGQDREFEFMALSDGQRQLIMLYTILEALREGTFKTLLIDEPDNYVSLREIQPWIMNLKDVCEENDRQAIIISHHPEIINKMARGDELLFLRQEGMHVITKPMPPVGDLTPAEIVARGWENE